MPDPIYLALIATALILFLTLFLFKKINDRVKDINLKTDFLDQKMDSVRTDIVTAMNQQYTDIITAIKNLEQKTEAEARKELKDDELYDEAKQVVVEDGKASASFLQRRLRIGYAQASRLLDKMEEGGIVGPADGAKPREILKNKSK